MFKGAKFTKGMLNNLLSATVVSLLVDFCEVFADIPLQSPSFSPRRSHRHLSKVASPKNPIPDDLVADYAKDKTNLFNTWLACNKQWGECTVYKAHKRREEKGSDHQKSFTNKRDVIAKYGEAKGNDLIARCTAAKLFADDPNFPGDEEERQFLISDKILLSCKTTDIKEQGHSLAGVVDQAAAEAMLLGTETAGPHIPGLSAKASELCWGPKLLAIKDKEKNKDKDKKDKDKKDKDKDKSKETEPVTKATALENASSFCDRMLTEATEARKHAVGVKQLEFSTEPGTQHN